MVSCVQELMGSTSIAQRIGFLSRFSQRDTGTMYIFLQAKFQLSGGILNLFFRLIFPPPNFWNLHGMSLLLDQPRMLRTHWLTAVACKEVIEPTETPTTTKFSLEARGWMREG